MIKDSPKSAQLTYRFLPSNLRISARLLQIFRIPHRIAESWGYQGKTHILEDVIFLVSSGYAIQVGADL